MKRLLATTAIVCGALWFHPTTAQAGPLGFFEAYTLTDHGVSGDPTISAVLPKAKTALSLLTVLNTNVTYNLAVFAPQGSCTGPDCTGFSLFPYHPNHLITDPFTLVFTFTDPNGGIKTLSENGVFLADYTGHLPCVGADPISQAQSDCVIWGGLSTTHDNYASPQSDVRSVAFGDGYVLNVSFNNAIDWNITPTVTFDVTAAPVPEPYAIALLGLGLLGTVAAASRKRR